jgi:hypothetical protein
LTHLPPYFPQLVGYQRFVELMPRALVLLCGSLSTRKGRCTGIAFIDATPLAVHDNSRIATHKVFAGLGGQLFGDRGSISQALHDVLFGQGLELLTKIRRNMKNRVMRLWDRLLLRKRS